MSLVDPYAKPWPLAVDLNSHIAPRKVYGGDVVGRLIVVVCQKGLDKLICPSLGSDDLNEVRARGLKLPFQFHRGFASMRPIAVKILSTSISTWTSRNPK